MKNTNLQHLIVLDLDGTLLEGFDTYDEETFAYLRKLNKDGHIVMIATGRPYRSSNFVYEALNLHSPIINYNGARVTNPTDPTYPITDIRIDKEDLLDIVEHVKEYLIGVFCEVIDDIYVQNYTEGIHPFLHADGGTLHKGDLKETLNDNPNGALFFLKEEKVKEFEDYINNEYIGKLYTRYWGMNGYHIVEVYSPLVDKQMSFIKIMEYYQIPKERTIAIGDGHNDIGLVEAAGIGVAMGNAHPELKKIAKYHTSDYKHQGVLKFLKEYFGK